MLMLMLNITLALIDIVLIGVIIYVAIDILT